MVDNQINENHISCIVINWCFEKPSKQEVLLRLDLQMFDGHNKILYFKLKDIPQLFDLFGYPNSYDDGYSLELFHKRFQCKTKTVYRETPLGRMKMGYDIICIRKSIHDEWHEINPIKQYYG